MVGVGLGLALACGGAAEGPPGIPPIQPIQPIPPDPEPVGGDAGGPPALLQPIQDGGRCAFTRSDDGSVLAAVDGECSAWTLSVNPKDASDVVFAIGPRVARTRGALPALPAGDLDGLGFDASGALIALVDRHVDPERDDDAEKAWVTVDGARVDVDYEISQMFSVVLCEAHRIEGDRWTRAAGPAVTQLFEGMWRPYCSGLASFASRVEPGQGRFEVKEVGEVSDALAVHARGDDLVSMHEVVGHPLAVGGIWFEGLLLNTPLVRRDGEGWKPLEGLDEPGTPLGVEVRGSWLLACTPGASHLYDASRDHARVWTGPAPCPTFWPVAP